MIDVHCHFDMASNPIKYISDNERKEILTIGMTNLPSHFQMGIQHIRNFKKIRLALGLHPLRAKDHEREYSKFRKYVNETSYIGEVGLDFSSEGILTKEIQIKSFGFVLDCISNHRKILSIHSRRAENISFEMLKDKEIKNAIFHWYTGPSNIMQKIASEGFYFSINSAMINSISGQKIVSVIPKELVLTETDYPFIEKSSIKSTYNFLSKIWNTSEFEVERIIDDNFKRLLLSIK